MFYDDKVLVIYVKAASFTNGETVFSPTDLRHVTDPVARDSDGSVAGHAPEHGDAARIEITSADDARQDGRFAAAARAQKAVTEKK